MEHPSQNWVPISLRSKNLDLTCMEGALVGVSVWFGFKLYCRVCVHQVGRSSCSTRTLPLWGTTCTSNAWSGNLVRAHWQFEEERESGLAKPRGRHSFTQSTRSWICRTLLSFSSDPRRRYSYILGWYGYQTIYLSTTCAVWWSVIYRFIMSWGLKLLCFESNCVWLSERWAIVTPGVGGTQRRLLNFTAFGVDSCLRRTKLQNKAQQSEWKLSPCSCVCMRHDLLGCLLSLHSRARRSCLYLLQWSHSAKEGKLSCGALLLCRKPLVRLSLRLSFAYVVSIVRPIYDSKYFLQWFLGGQRDHDLLPYKYTDVGSHSPLLSSVIIQKVLQKVDAFLGPDFV